MTHAFPRPVRILATLAVAAALAVLVPTLRATGVSPTEALRQD